MIFVAIQMEKEKRTSLLQLSDKRTCIKFSLEMQWFNKNVLHEASNFKAKKYSIPKFSKEKKYQVDDFGDDLRSWAHS